LWSDIQDTSIRQKFRPETVSIIAPAKGTPCWSEDILMEILSTLWLVDLSPRERRAILCSVPLVCKHWLQACARIFLTNAYIVSPRTDLFEPLCFKNLLGNPSLESMTRTYTRMLSAPKSPPAYRHLEISRHLALGYQDTGCTALPGAQGTGAGALPASLLRDAIDMFRHLEYMPNLSSLVMEYRVYRETDAAPLHRATFRVVHVAVEYHFLSHWNRDENEDSSSHLNPTQHWIAEELGLLPTSVSRAAKRNHLLNTLPDLNLVSFTCPHANTHFEDPIVLRAIGDMISMGAGSVSTSKADDGRSIGVNVHGGLQGLEGKRFALVHGSLNKNNCVVKPPDPAPQPPPLPRRRRQSMSFQFNTNKTLPRLPNSVKGTALALVINLGDDESLNRDFDDVCTSGLREARIFSKKSSI
jgi:hypothetical protein